MSQHKDHTTYLIKPNVLPHLSEKAEERVSLQSMKTLRNHKGEKNKTRNSSHMSVTRLCSIIVKIVKKIWMSVTSLILGILTETGKGSIHLMLESKKKKKIFFCSTVHTVVVSTIF